MIKSKRIQPKHVSICLDLPSKDNIPSSPSPNYKKQFLYGNRSNSIQQRAMRDIIRLGSKLKKIKKEQKQNIPNQTLQINSKYLKPHLQTELSDRLKPEKKQSFSKQLKNTRHTLTQTQQQNYRTETNTSQSYSHIKKNPKIKNQCIGKQNSNIFKCQTLLSKINKISQQNNVRSQSKNKQESSRKRSLSTNNRLKNKEDSAESRITLNLKKIKQLRFVSEYLTDLQIQGILNQLQLAGILQAKWPLIVVDKVYQFIRKKQWNDPKDQIIRMF